MTHLDSPSLEEWRKLYDVAAQVKALAPWEWMTEEDVFGVLNPETNEPGFVSVMGMLGEHFSIALYLGAKGLYGLWDLEREGDERDPEQLLAIPELQASFEDRNVLRDQDRQIVKQLGLKFRGRNAWPMFRGYRPGCFPWYLEAAEARFLTHALEQTLDVTPRFREDHSLFHMPNNVSYLVRAPQRQEDKLVWKDQVMEVLPPEPEPIQFVMDMQAIEHLKHLPQSQNILEIDFFMFPSPVQEEKGERPVFPYNLMMVDAQSGFILGTELLIPDPTLEAMWGKIPLTVARTLAAAGGVPQEIKVRSELLLQVLKPLAEELHLLLRQSRSLRSLDQAKREMSRFAKLGWEW